MSKRNFIIGVGVGALAIAWYAFRPELLFINKTVSEEFPGGAALASIEKGPRVVTKGDFKGLAHETKGSASVYQLPDGKRTLRLTDFETSNGPDVHVYLTAANVDKGNSKAHELDNLYVVDGSFFVSSGAVNPALTIIANALRVGDHIIEKLR